jgi:hypothetical protein
MSTRYATIIPNDEGEEVVSNIAQIEGAAPQVSFGTVEKVADGVLIGMVRGGTKDAVGEWGFPEDAPGAEGRTVGIAKANAASERAAKSAKPAKAGKATKTSKPAVDEQPAPPASPADADA